MTLSIKKRVNNNTEISHYPFTTYFTEDEMQEIREYLMAPVIEELERLISLCENRWFLDQMTAYKRAITLIKEGVKKE